MRLIDADALMRTIIENDYPLVDALNSHGCGMFTIGIAQAINEQPTIEAEPVRHGRWVTNNRGFAECTECKFERIGIPLVHRLNYCPNCGAKMDGDDHAV